MSGFFTQSFKIRLISTLVLVPIVIAILYYGGIAFLAFLAFGFVVSSYEFVKMTKGHKYQVPILIACIAYIAMAHLGFYGLHKSDNILAIVVMLAVWASDIGAYVVGKIVKGPKLLPNISPNKTWSGFSGALFFAALPLLVYGSTLEICKGIGSCFPVFSSVMDYALLVVAGFLFGATCQVGDLLISFLKRKVGVKDTGTLIPGHGGILDRIDSLIFVSFIAFLLYLPDFLSLLSDFLS